jgi:large subunit ribosomal protein L22
MLVVARDHAVNYKRLDQSKLVVGQSLVFLTIDQNSSSRHIAESWVTKGPKSAKRFEPRGRGHFGIRVHPDARMHVVLREGKTPEEQAKEARARKLKRIVSAGLVREDKPLRNPGPMWAW